MFKKLQNYKKIRPGIIIFASLIFIPLVFNIIKKARNSEVYAIDPLVVTYAGGPPTNPMFYVTNMLPGDEEEKVFNVKNDSTEDEQVTMDTIMTQELKSFSHILEVEVTDLSIPAVIFTGTLKQMLDLPPLSLGAFLAGKDKDFRVKVKFPDSAGNEYQNALVIFDVIWRTDAPPLELPEECKILEGQIVNIIEGTDGDDHIKGTNKSDLIYAKGGRDKVRAGRGNDCIIGGDGDDIKLDGSYGNDIIVGGPGNDMLDGSDGNDILYGGDGDDEIRAGDNDDIVFGGSGDDEIDGGGNNDAIFADEGNDVIEGGSGNDSIYGEEGNDTIDGESGQDYIYGGIGNDILDGGSDNDHIYGEEDDDSIKGGSGNDFIDGGPGINDINGDSGTDECINAPIFESCES